MFTLYPNGAQFRNENAEILRNYPLETIFFAGNAARMDDRADGFVVKVSEGDDFLLCMRYMDFPMSIWGCERLCGELAEGLLRNGLTFGRVLTSRPIADSFFASYERVVGGSHTDNREMLLMQCREPADGGDVEDVKEATLADAEELAALYAARFAAEGRGGSQEARAYLQTLNDEIGNFAIARIDGRIASIARRARETEYLCSVTGVYTVEEFRGRGLARRVTGYLTDGILAQGKVPYLFVETDNATARNLYLSLGYEVVAQQVEIAYHGAADRGI